MANITSPQQYSADSQATTSKQKHLQHIQYLEKTAHQFKYILGIPRRIFILKVLTLTSISFLCPAIGGSERQARVSTSHFAKAPSDKKYCFYVSPDKERIVSTSHIRTTMGEASAQRAAPGRAETFWTSACSERNSPKFLIFKIPETCDFCTTNPTLLPPLSVLNELSGFQNSGHINL